MIRNKIDGVRPYFMRARYITTLIVCFHVSMALLLSLLIGVIVWNWIIGLVCGGAIWSLILFKTSVFNLTFINVMPNWALVMGNQLIHDKLSNNPNDRIAMFDLKSMREVHSGLQGRYPWEVVYESIDLQSELAIGRDGQKRNLLQCYTKDNISLEIEYQVILTPLRGYLVNLVRKSEKVSRAFFRGQFDQFIIHWVKSRNENQVFSSLNNLGEEFRNIFGKRETASKVEQDYGLFANTPQITMVKRSARYQAAAEGVMIGKSLCQVISEINRPFDEAGIVTDPNMVLATAAAVVGTPVKGLLLIPGLSNGAANIAATIAMLKKTNEMLEEK